MKQRTSTSLYLTPKRQDFLVPSSGSRTGPAQTPHGQLDTVLVNYYYAELTGFRWLADQEGKAHHTFFLRTKFLTAYSDLTGLRQSLFQNLALELCTWKAPEKVPAIPLPPQTQPGPTAHS